jgi:hypothetical protein
LPAEPRVALFEEQVENQVRPQHERHVLDHPAQPEQLPQQMEQLEVIAVSEIGEVETGDLVAGRFERALNAGQAQGRPVAVGEEDRKSVV